MKRIPLPLPAVILLLFVAVAVLLMAAVLAHADSGSLPPEWPPGVVCELPTATAPIPYPPPGDGYPSPYPAPEFLPVVMESYP